MTDSKKIDITSSKWLSGIRLRQSTVDEDRTILEEAHSDRGRVVFSASFRRLSQKTQVFALSSDGARTRLTHSLEVAHIGMYLVSEIFSRIKKNISTRSSEEQKKTYGVWEEFGESERLAIRSFVEVACLVHDIGNPPFGHFGEKAICNWFSLESEGGQWLSSVLLSMGDRQYDFVGFDGNKQGFRILTRLQRNGGDAFGLNLTATQLASIVKYPNFSVGSPNKCGYFFSEEDKKKEIWNKLDLPAEARHPLSLIMEAADDIAYCISDLEDAADKGLVTIEDLKIAFDTVSLDQENFAKSITAARTALTNSLVKSTADAFLDRVASNTEVECDSLIGSDERLDRLREVVSRKVYSSRLVLSNEVTGYKVIHGILDAFLPLMKMNSADFKTIAKSFSVHGSIFGEDGKSVVKRCTAEPSLLSLFPRKHLAVYLQAIELAADDDEIYHRLHLIVDFVAGMTDDFALDTFRLLSGQMIYGQS